MDKTQKRFAFVSCTRWTTNYIPYKCYCTAAFSEPNKGTRIVLLHGRIVWSVLFESWNGSERSKVLKRKNQLNSKRLSSAQIACALHVHFKILDKGRIIWKKKQNSPVAITFWMMFIRMRLDFIDRMITSIDIPNITGQMRTSWKQANYMTVFRIWNQLSHVGFNLMSVKAGKVYLSSQ